ncbi:mannose-1-phosphate guanylyltransferase and mannose-6-phosphate isomerase [Syntrophotalea carbinolica DSM 2380]|uniref:mannose-1-phosphate guanylyltransferase n=1 Tax=Syntrophotalea carbinolica (strain DSM 2380 / NBRC 103641 / GraBd1) TaxID=338963 RepID=Q3A529_SYNC1|nr:mannose-1-phosphate guanylyltransferase/mannose-6-phosphate isomerase [Syntrophotalea carbinolica]ABA88528.1 mannose-1-phosphate guanylyltransferase and mannose-6-phosphate isomerase [Syntrophotalea carbinolica DSM 2380]
MIVPVILSGGSGSRLWPLSREMYPKQFLSLVNEKSMLQDTVTRLGDMADLAAPMVVCNESHRFIVADQMANIGHPPSAVLLEPIGRNTGPAVALAAMHAIAAGDDPVLLILPADHVIQDSEKFCETFAAAKSYALDGKLITFGVVPTVPETGYGYIRKGDPAQTGGNAGLAYDVVKFQEKPDVETARRYLDCGDYLWNSGIFMFLASRYLEELERFSPEIIEACRLALSSSRKKDHCIFFDSETFARCPGISIDHAVLEKTTEAVVLPLEAGWNDVGSWDALWAMASPDGNGDVVIGDVVRKDTRNSYFRATTRLLAAVGVEGVVVVETDDSVLVCSKDRVQDIKSVVDELRSKNRDEVVLNNTVYRPWGSYKCMDREQGFQVKRITVKPGASLSLQMHHHRAEHWIVVKGEAKVTRGDEILMLSENQSTYIPLGVIHRLENPGEIPLELIEVQSGSYLGEDDIVRLDDQYGR